MLHFISYCSREKKISKSRAPHPYLERYCKHDDLKIGRNASRQYDYLCSKSQLLQQQPDVENKAASLLSHNKKTLGQSDSSVALQLFLHQRSASSIAIYRTVTRFPKSHFLSLSNIGIFFPRLRKIEVYNLVHGKRRKRQKFRIEKRF